jgi:hypothetical protein
LEVNKFGRPLYWSYKGHTGCKKIRKSESLLLGVFKHVMSRLELSGFAVL